MPKPSLLLVAVLAFGLLVPRQAGAAPARADEQQAVVRLRYLRFSVAEAVPGEPITATWATQQAIRNPRLLAAVPDGQIAGMQPMVISATINRARTAGSFTFVLTPTLELNGPLNVALVFSGGSAIGSSTLRLRCAFGWSFTPRVDRCPNGASSPSPAAYQIFENGLMLWDKGGDAVRVLFKKPASNAPGLFAVRSFADQFNEGDPETDPTLIAPAGLQQPRRGFGLVWRTYPEVRQALGWALAEESAYSACWMSAFGGSRSSETYVNDPEGRILQLNAHTAGYTSWRPVAAIDGQPVTFLGCG